MRDLKFEYSQLESDSGEAYNLRCYLWQDSKAALREGPQDIVGAKQLYLAQAGSANVGGVAGLSKVTNNEYTETVMHSKDCHVCTNLNCWKIILKNVTASGVVRHILK